MTTLSIHAMDPLQPLVVKLGQVLPRPLTPDEFWDFCQQNPDLHIENSAAGELVIMTPSGYESDGYNAELVGQLIIWNRRERLGKVLGSSAGFRLPNGACRSPDAAWVLKSRSDAVPRSERRRFPKLTPDFVAEIRSPSDRLADLQAKMLEYRDCGVRLGWLLDPDTRTVWIYEPGAEPRQLDDPATVDGGSTLVGFVLDLQEVWGD
jgi:Uma2 family endonuclease